MDGDISCELLLLDFLLFILNSDFTEIVKKSILLHPIGTQRTIIPNHELN